MKRPGGNLKAIYTPCKSLLNDVFDGVLLPEEMARNRKEAARMARNKRFEGLLVTLKRCIDKGVIRNLVLCKERGAQKALFLVC